ncbi:VQ motif-containing protein 4 [Prunus yedoensis var. nudiflora]|uniref:VQ motif-containing protein 4 n=1 Tax=Prunus yedoensis var. nudiflora TaxID=2094558 RepID=A0A314ZIN9_PRUYE|nr:VQ motif-containing protein 4 [Prunus yedoensis var. nudiflora]
MEFSSRPQEIREKQPYSYSPINSPRSNGTNTNTKTNTNSSVCSTNTNTTNNNSSGVQIPTTPKLTTPRSDPNPYPTTFVQADTTNFKHVVQMLTGSSETVSHQSSPKPTTTHHHHHPTAIKIQPFCPPPTKASTSHQSKQPLPKSKASSSMRGGAPISKTPS